MSLSTPYFENNLASISANPAGYAHLTYHANSCTLNDLQTVLGHTGDLLLHHRWHMLLEDHRQLLSLTAEQQGIMVRYWQQQTRLLGRPLCVATVLARNVFARLSVAALRHELQTTDINYRSFSDPAAASSWILIQIGRSQLM
ncbi:MAG: hypothetical protein ACRYG7_23280 [Janthinobacterium lividum]